MGRTKQPIGAWTTVEWHDGGRETAYISFGQWNEDDNTDSYGVEDDAIFFYAHEGERQLNKLLTGYIDGFNVDGYELVYDISEV